MHRHSLSFLPSSDQHRFFVSPRLLLPRQKAETAERLRIGDPECLCGVLRAGKGGAARLADCSTLEKPRKSYWTGLRAQSLSTLLSGCSLLCWDDFLPLSKQNKTNTGFVVV